MSNRIAGDAVEWRHIHEASDEVREAIGGLLDVDDKYIVDRITALSHLLVKYEDEGNAEKAHEVAKTIAAVSTLYLARGLA
jgi:hypothetical protein